MARVFSCLRVAVFNPDVRFTPESGHVRCTSRCPLSANSGHSILSACGSGEGVPSNPKCGKSILFKFDTGRVLPRQRPLVFLRTPSGDNAAKLALALSSMGYVRTYTASAWSEAEFQKIVSQIRPERRRIGRTLAAECQERHDGCMGSGRTRSTTPDLSRHREESLCRHRSKLGSVFASDRRRGCRGFIAIICAT